MVSQKDTDAPKPSQHFVDAAQPGSIMVVSAPLGSYQCTLGFGALQLRHTGSKTHCLSVIKNAKTLSGAVSCQQLLPSKESKLLSSLVDVETSLNMLSISFQWVVSSKHAAKIQSYSDCERSTTGLFEGNTPVYSS